MRFTNKVALVTGAASGIGEAVAAQLLTEGATVYLVDRQEERLQQAVAKIGMERAFPVVADVANAASMEAAFARVRAEQGHLDVVCANAGINGVWCPLEEMEPEEWDATFAVNLRGTFLTLKYAIPLLKINGGSVVIVSSINGSRIYNNFGASAYSASKAGQVSLAKSAALELARQDVRVNVVCPGAVHTNIGASTYVRNLERIRIPVHYPDGHSPLNPGGVRPPSTVAEAILFLASDAASQITGTEMYVDGAESLL